MTQDKNTPEWKAQKTYAQNRADSKMKAGLPPLTPEEEARPFAKYYYDEIPQPDPAHYAKMERPIDPARAFGPEEINRLLDVGRLETEEVEIGWCNLPDGAGFIANTIVYPGVTAHMIDWWFAWHPLEDLRYRIWYPPQHAGIMLSPVDRARILDPAIPNREKNWGVTHYVTENCDCGMENVDIGFRSPADMGFDMDRFDKVAATFAGQLHHRPGHHVPHVLRRCRRPAAPYPFLDGLPLHRARQARGVPPPGGVGARGGGTGAGSSQRQGVHAFWPVPASHPQGTRPQHVLLSSLLKEAAEQRSHGPQNALVGAIQCPRSRE
jgi:hypothetical protein